jgi:hypothetical protein
MNNYHDPVLPPKTLDEVCSDIQRIVRSPVTSTRAPSGWTHLSVPHGLPADTHPLVRPSGHVDGKWETTYVQLRPHVLDALAPHIFLPVWGLELIAWKDGTIRLVATGANCIGGCTICLVKPEIV